MMKRILFFLPLLFVLVACHSNSTDRGVRDLAQIQEEDTLRVLTLYGPTSYFLYKDNEMGYEYELAKYLAKDMGVAMKTIVLSSLEEMIEALQDGEGDVIAFRVPYTTGLRQKVSFTQKEYTTNQVIVQCQSDSMFQSVLDLSGHQVHVIPQTIFEERLHALNDEIGGGIEIVPAHDSMGMDDLIHQVARHQIRCVVSDDMAARLNKTYFGNIDYHLDISFPQRSAWVVSLESPELLAYVNDWVKRTSKKAYVNSIYHKYFERSKYFVSAGFERIPQPHRVSSFDEYFKKSARKMGWDWRMLASVAYEESKFNPTIVSWAGACGLMQLMPNTALSLGLTPEEIHDPEKNIQAAAKYFKKLEKLFPGVEDELEREKFVLAAYNAGPGHIFDARALTKKYGGNQDLWSDVREYLLKKADPDFYTDEVCRFGYCRGEEPVNYVDRVLTKFQDYLLWAR